MLLWKETSVNLCIIMLKDFISIQIYIVELIFYLPHVFKMVGGAEMGGVAISTISGSVLPYILVIVAGTLRGSSKSVSCS